MNNTWYPHQAPYLKSFADHLLRWNNSINLISRQSTEELLGDLFRQCLGGFTALWEQFEKWGVPVAASEVYYFDLGSGGGIPGVLWHHELARKGVQPKTCLVEPREKRAWFLEKVPGDPNVVPFSTFNGRWGEGACVSEPVSGSPIYIVSLKALHLNDEEVLGGLMASFESLASGCVVLARFYPSEKELTAELKKHLQLTPTGGSLSCCGRVWVSDGHEILRWSKPGPREACLVVSRYSF